MSKAKKRTLIVRCSFCKKSEKRAGKLLSGGPTQKKGVSITPRICEQCSIVACTVFMKMGEAQKQNGGAENSGPAKTQGETPHE